MELDQLEIRRIFPVPHQPQSEFSRVFLFLSGNHPESGTVAVPEATFAGHSGAPSHAQVEDEFAVCRPAHEPLYDGEATGGWMGQHPQHDHRADPPPTCMYVEPVQAQEGLPRGVCHHEPR